MILHAKKTLIRQIFLGVFCLVVVTIDNNIYAEVDRAKRPFVRIESFKTGLNVPIPDRPAWKNSIEPRAGTYALLISTPEKFYPQVSMELVLNHRINLNSIKFESVVVSGLNTIRKKSGVNEVITKADLKRVVYGDMQAYEDSYQMESKERNYSIRSIMGLMPSGHPITIFIATPKGQMNHIKDITNTIIKNLKELPKDIK
ncbi:hypothetical protein GCM10009133_04380 [Cocleimonas flava]|uniref:PsbP C-terminal domain-containing protein n=1 Tax=Cocleimonas flava TaxID=634765 RepID=A0A4R1F4Y2_9GAMM|nr:hypothetical protein [Cocleimonas flava]TCJ86808.1 hypothetical protein EV695_1306 [Cocleimonas flava]